MCEGQGCGVIGETCCGMRRAKGCWGIMAGRYLGMERGDELQRESREAQVLILRVKMGMRLVHGWAL